MSRRRPYGLLHPAPACRHSDCPAEACRYTAAPAAGYSEADTLAEAWEKYRAAHPEVLASWCETNGRWPYDHPNRHAAELEGGLDR